MTERWWEGLDIELFELGTDAWMAAAHIDGQGCVGHFEETAASPEEAITTLKRAVLHRRSTDQTSKE